MSETNVVVLCHKKIPIQTISDLHVYVMVLLNERFCELVAPEFGVYTFMHPVSRDLLPISPKRPLNTSLISKTREANCIFSNPVYLSLTC